MKPDPLDQMLTAYAEQPLPPDPTRLNVDIRAEIARRCQASFWARFFPPLGWHEFFSEPRFAVVALGFALVTGAVPAVVLARTESTHQLAQQAMHFEVFSSGASNQLATLITRLPESGSRP